MIDTSISTFWNKLGRLHLRVGITPFDWGWKWKLWLGDDSCHSYNFCVIIGPIDIQGGI